MAFLFPKGSRLLARADYLRVQRTGEPYSSGSVLLRVSPCGVEGRSRVGITVSTKVDKRAVARNRFKRCCRETVRHLLPRFERCVDAVVIARGSVRERPPRDVARDVRRAFEKAGVVPVGVTVPGDTSRP